MKNQSGEGVFIPFALSLGPSNEGHAASPVACIGGPAAALSSRVISLMVVAASPLRSGPQTTTSGCAAMRHRMLPLVADGPTWAA
jgi:hypothetical protein